MIRTSFYTLTLCICSAMLSFREVIDQNCVFYKQGNSPATYENINDKIP